MSVHDSLGGSETHDTNKATPRSVKAAAALMYAGGGLWFLLSAVALPMTMGDLADDVRWSLERQQPAMEPAAIDGAVAVSVALVIAISLLFVGLWIWMAIMNLRGRAWARVLASVLFALDCPLFLLALAGSGGDLVALLPTATVWLIGLGAVVLLWRGENAEHFARRAGAG